jgi:carbon-monoxide dehydrogenase small subunit
MTPHAVSLSFNGRKAVWHVAAGTTLLDAVRVAGATGAQEGCGVGECGACMVLIDGVPAVSCLVLAVEVERRSVTTIEAPDDALLTRMRNAFLAEGAVQCGACTPGMVVVASRIRAGSTEAEIRDALAGNACRCTGYASIVRAVRRAWEEPGGIRR